MIILVEDDNLQAKLLCHLLKNNDIDILHFETGKDLINFVLRENNLEIKLIIIDCFLPDYSGDQILQILNDNELKLRTCIFSANDCDKLKSKVKDLGTIDFFIKGKTNEIKRLIKLIKSNH